MSKQACQTTVTRHYAQLSTASAHTIALCCRVLGRPMANVSERTHHETCPKPL